MKKWFFILFFFSFAGSAIGQIEIKYQTPQKKAYLIGDTISLIIDMKTLPETCVDGMRQSKIYVSGLKIDNQTDWKELQKGYWQKQITLLVLANKKNQAKLTVTRKVDKESLFKQEILKIRNE